MDLYLVRHGETAANTRHVYQKPSEPISALGAAEVARLVRHIQNIQPTHIYTSDFKRARETAHYFGYATGLEPVWLPSLHEVYPPETLIDRSRFSPASFSYLLRWFFGWYTPAPDSKAETKEMFVHRILKTRAHMEAQHGPGDRVVAVTHSVFLNFFIAHLCADEHVNVFGALPLFYKILRFENSGITHVRYIGETEKNVCPWELVSHNGHDHLQI